MDGEYLPPEERTKDQEAAEALYALVAGPLAAAQARLAAHSRAIPSSKDFHFYSNFDQFKNPAREVSKKSLDLLARVGTCGLLSEGQRRTKLPDDLEDACDWIVSVNDDLLERFGVAMDEFKSSRDELEAAAVAEGKAGRATMEEGGFQMVRGKKKKKGSFVDDGTADSGGSDSKAASKDKKITPARFHIPTIPRPQEEYNILVNNTNKPFDHVWLEKREDGSFIHPLEMLSVNDFVNRTSIYDKPVEPPPLESTPFKFVEDVAELKKLASALCGVSEFAVDLEHNQYRSFLGLTCLMQISTRNEDYVVDTLKLRVHIGPHLREVFKDPTKRKVMHGADKDILWLQRDFGIYVCNMFDTGQASRLLQLERNSLEYLLRHYCGVTANKEYQNADWRLRPLPEEMIKYAREDTHYLLYLYDVMSRELQSASTVLETDDKLLEVYKRSSEICMQLYQKDLLTEMSYMYIYGLREADFNSQQLAVAAGLCKWRDDVARLEDESTGYILPNRLVIDIARHLPSSTNQLRRLLRSRHTFVERNLGSIVSIVQNSIENAADFEYAVEQLRKDRLEAMSELNKESICDDSEMPQTTEDSTAREKLASENMDETGNIQATKPLADSSSIFDHVKAHAKHVDSGGSDASVVHLTVESQSSIKSQVCCATIACNASSLSNESIMLGSTKMVNAPSVTVLKKPTGGLGALLGGCSRQSNTSSIPPPSDLVKAPSVSVLKKPTGAFGALLGTSTRKSSIGAILGSTDLKNERKLQQIKSSVSLPFHTFSGLETSKPDEVPHDNSPSQPPELGLVDSGPSDKIFQVEEMIPLENDSDSQLSEETDVADEMKDAVQTTAEVGDTEKKPSSLAELSSSFEQCFKPIRQTNSVNSGNRPQIFTNLTHFHPFDYAAARKTADFTGRVQREEAENDDEEGKSASKGSRGKKKGSSSMVPGDSRRAEYQAPRRRQAFPPTGNRSGTFL